MREIERRLEIAARASIETPDVAVPYGVPASFDAHIRLQLDLLALAFQADITRVSTLLYARDLTGRVYPESGTSASFHGASHHAEEPSRVREYAMLNRYHVGTLAHFVEKLRSIPDGDGTLLDHTLVLYGSNMGNSNQHLHYDVPHVLNRRRLGAARRGAAPGLSPAQRDDGKSAAEHHGHVRRAPRPHRRQHGPAGGAVGVSP